MISLNEKKNENIIKTKKFEKITKEIKQEKRKTGKKQMK